MKSSILICVVVSGTMLFYGCVNQVEPEEGATDAKVRGTLFLSDAVHPAKNTLVTLQSRRTLAMTSDDGSVTDAARQVVRTLSDGSYHIASCPAGVYVLDAMNDSNNAVRIDSVIIKDNEKTVVQSAALNTLGSITGTVVLSGGGSLLNVFVLVYGSERYVQVQEDGTYEIDELPYGNYELKVLSVHPHYPEFRTVDVTVEAGTQTVLDTVVLEMTGITPPEKLYYTYNPINRRVLLEWEACESEEVIGYNVYRRSIPREEWFGKIPLNNELITDATSFVDSVIECDSTYVYAVSAVSNVSVEKKCPPCTLTTNCINYDVDTISFTDGEIPRNLFWGEDGILNVVCDAQGKVIVNEYAENRQLLSKKEIPIKQSTAYNTILRDSRLYLMRNEGDSIMFGYTDDGDSLFACNVKEKINRFSVRDTLLYALTYNDYMYNDIIRLKVYDFHGNHLYDLNEGHLFHMIRQATDGQLYSIRFNNVKGGCEVLRYERILPECTEIPSRSVIFFDASEKYRLYLNNDGTDVDIADKDNVLIATINYAPWLSLYDLGRMQWPRINDRGEFVGIEKERVYIFTPPE